MFRCVVFAVLLFLCSCLFVSGDPARQFGPNHEGFDFFGHSGAFVLWTIDGAHWVKVKFHKLQEVDTAGNVVAQARNFADFDFQWSEPILGFQWNANFIEVKLINNELEVDTKAGNQFQVQFEVDTFIFKNAVNMTFANELISAKAGQLKWQVSVKNWQFQNVNNTLRYAVQLISDQFANNTAYSRLDHVPGTVSSFALAFGKANLIVPQVALIDGKAAAVKTAVLYEAGQLVVQWDYPSFTASLLYDPVTMTDNLILSVSEATRKGLSALTLAMAMLTAVFSMLR